MQMQFITRLYLYFVGVKILILIFYVLGKILIPIKAAFIWSKSRKKYYYKLKITVFC